MGQVRPARPIDLAIVRDIEGSSLQDPWSERAWEDECSYLDSMILVHEDADGVDGFLVARHGGGDGEILRIAVRVGRRRRGVASRLLQAATQFLTERGCRRVFLEVRADNPAAVALYEAHGLVIRGRRPAYYPDGCDALIYGAELNISAR